MYIVSWESSASSFAKRIFRIPDALTAAADGETLARPRSTTSGFCSRLRILPADLARVAADLANLFADLANLIAALGCLWFSGFGALWVLWDFGGLWDLGGLLGFGVFGVFGVFGLFWVSNYY